MKKILLPIISSAIIMTGCNAGTNGSSNAGNTITSNQHALTGISNPGLLIKAAYVDLGAIGSYDAIPNSGFAGANVMIFGFADTNVQTISATQTAQLKKAMAAEKSGTINLLSLGGEYATPSTFNTNTVTTIASNIISQINDFNSKNDVKIDGVDLDLEQGINGDTIASLTNLFKQAGLKVGAAPQVYLSDASNIDSTNPTNMVLTSGMGLAQQNVYQDALNTGKIDYLFVQTYNTGGFTIDNIGEDNIHFIKNTAKALNNTVKTQCTGYTLCIPTTTNIVVGTVANKYAGGVATPFYGNATPADQQATLDTLKSDIDSMVNDANYNHFAGTMVWSLNMDYAANLYSTSNTAYTAGAFTSTIFDGNPTPPPSTLPYFILQVSNNAPNQANLYAYSSVTLITNDNYFIFGNQWDLPITPQYNQSWGTLPSSQDTPGVINSDNLDNVFSNGNTSFTATIQVNGYQTNTDLYSPTGSFKCRSNPTYTFEAGHSYNIIVNAVDNSNGTAACEVKKVS